MLSRIVRAAPLRRCGARTFSSVISSEGRSEAQLLQEINSIPNVDGNETSVVVAAGEDAFELRPVNDAELADHLAEQAINLQSSAEENDEGFLEAIGLGPFHRRAALVTTGILTAVSNEFYVANEETFVAACLLGGFTVMHVLLREGVLDAYSTFQNETLSAQNNVWNHSLAIFNKS